MKKIQNFILVPIVAAVLLVAIFGTAALSQTQKDYRRLETKIDALSEQMSSLKENIGSAQIAGASTASLPSPTPTPIKKSTTKILADTPKASATPTPQPSPSPFNKIALVKTAKKSSGVSVQPIPQPTPSITKKALVEITGQNNYQIELKSNDTAFSILTRAAAENGFAVDYKDYGDLGIMVTCIGGICAHDNYYWAFYYNDAYAQVGASAQPVKENDITSWKFETF